MCRILVVVCAVAMCVSTYGAAPRPPVDPDTPPSARYTVPKTSGHTGIKYEIVFSDEFQKAGRTFADGDDPYWTAQDLWKVTTNDMEYYSPSPEHVTTADGSCVITATQDQTIQYCPYTSGMINTWNKICFQGGIFEFSLKLPDDMGTAKGWWPAAWMMGNLGRTGFVNSTNGPWANGRAIWPWTYNACDGNSQWQYFNACDANPGNGFNPKQGRGAPEIDILEPRIGGSPHHPYPGPNGPTTPTIIQTYHFDPKNPAGVKYTGGMKVNNSTQVINENGDTYHDFIGCITPVAPDWFKGFHTHRLEWYPNGTLAWYVDDVFTFELDQYALRAYEKNGWTTHQRMIPEEPMYLIFNLAISALWDVPASNLKWPGKVLIDWVRVYQDPSKVSISCDPASHPTKQYIENHKSYFNDWKVCPPLPAGVCN